MIDESIQLQKDFVFNFGLFFLIKNRTVRRFNGENVLFTWREICFSIKYFLSTRMARFSVYTVYIHGVVVSLPFLKFIV